MYELDVGSIASCIKHQPFEGSYGIIKDLSPYSVHPHIRLPMRQWRFSITTAYLEALPYSVGYLLYSTQTPLSDLCQQACLWHAPSQRLRARAVCSRPTHAAQARPSLPPSAPLLAAPRYRQGRHPLATEFQRYKDGTMPVRSRPSTGRANTSYCPRWHGGCGCCWSSSLGHRAYTIAFQLVIIARSNSQAIATGPQADRYGLSVIRSCIRSRKGPFRLGSVANMPYAGTLLARNAALPASSARQFAQPRQSLSRRKSVRMAADGQQDTTLT